MKKYAMLFCAVVLLPSVLMAKVFEIPLKPSDLVKKAKDNLPAGIIASEEDKKLAFTAEAGHKNGSWTTELQMSPKKMGKTVVVSVKYKLELAEGSDKQLPPFIFECGGKKLHVRAEKDGSEEDEWITGRTKLRLPFSGKVILAVRFRKGEGKLILHSISADNGKKEEPEEDKKAEPDKRKKNKSGRGKKNKDEE